MFFAASKIVAWLIYPLGLGLLFLLLAYGASLLRKRRAFHILFLLGVSILSLFSIKPVADSLIGPLERKHLSPDPSDLKADAIVVLAGGTRKKVFPRTDVEVEGNRVLKAIRLYKQKAAPVIIMTGGSGNLFDPDFKEALLMKELAVELGVPGEKILVETESRNTRENAVYTKQVLDQIKARKVILVSAASHLPRSHAVFKKLGIDAVPVASDFHATNEKYDPLSFVPSAGSLALSSTAIKEYVGLVVYRLMGWM